MTVELKKVGNLRPVYWAFVLSLKVSLFSPRAVARKKIMTEAMSMVKIMTEAMSMVKFSS